MVSATQTGDLETGSGGFGWYTTNMAGSGGRLVRKINASPESEGVDTSVWLFFVCPEFWALTLLCSKIMLVNLLPFSALLILICS